MAKIQRSNSFQILKVEISFKAEIKGQQKSCLTAILATSIIIQGSADLDCIQNASEWDSEDGGLRTVGASSKHLSTLGVWTDLFLGTNYVSVKHTLTTRSLSITHTWALEHLPTLLPLCPFSFSLYFDITTGVGSVLGVGKTEMRKRDDISSWGQVSGRGRHEIRKVTMPWWLQGMQVNNCSESLNSRD